MSYGNLTFFIPAIAVLLFGCGENDVNGPSGDDINYRQEMRDFVTDLGAYAKNLSSGFIIIPQNGQELATDTGDAYGTVQTAYLASFDATGREDMFYGYNGDDQATPAEESQHFLELCLLCEQNGIEVLATDYCSTHSKMDDSYQVNEQNGFISFASDNRELSNIPDYPATPYNLNSNDITEISQAANFLYMINSVNYASKQDFIDAVSATSYDVVIMDLFHNEEAFTPAEIQQLKTKYNGGSRLVVCYLSIGEAEDYRYYWQAGWNTDKPGWLGAENPDWPGNYKVNYWDLEWQAIIFGNDDSYMKRIVDAGFDGAYLDLIDAFEYFED
jgi:cysteinyl-tRNA synthetase